jgi:hypothetical protein
MCVTLRVKGGRSATGEVSAAFGGGLAVPSSAVIDLAIGLTFVFGASAALASVVTEMIARLIGLRGAYLLTGLRELVDGSGATTDLADAQADYRNMQDLVRGAAARGQPSAGQSAAAPSSAEPSPAAPRSPAPSHGAPSPPEPSPAEPSPAEASAAAPPPPTPPSATGALLGSPILSSQGMTGQISSRKITVEPDGKAGGLSKMSADHLWRQRRSLPSYISSRSFADAVIDLVVPDAAGQTTMSTISRNIGGLPDNTPLKTSLQALASSAGTDVSRFRTGVEHWYDDHMDRVSGWYKRYVAKITLVIGAVLVLLLNINVLTIGRTLYTQSTVSRAISTVAAKGANCPVSQSRQDCLAGLQAELSAATTAGLPIGWGTVRDCTAAGTRCNWLDQRGIFSRHGNSAWQLVLVLAGFLIMIIALVPGARFWFGLLSKLGTLRAAGPKPAAAAS